MKNFRRVDNRCTSTLLGGRFTPGETASGAVGSRTGLIRCGKDRILPLAGIEIRLLDSRYTDSTIPSRGVERILYKVEFAVRILGNTSLLRLRPNRLRHSQVKLQLVHRKQRSLIHKLACVHSDSHYKGSTKS
jgi:hypothetical protein